VHSKKFPLLNHHSNESNVCYGGREWPFTFMFTFRVHVHVSCFCSRFEVTFIFTFTFVFAFPCMFPFTFAYELPRKGKQLSTGLCSPLFAEEPIQ